MTLRFDRSPDYFALPAAHSNEHETWLLTRGGEIVGLGSIVARPGYIDGSPETVLYLSELRTCPRRDVAGRWRSLLRGRLDAIRETTDARFGYCCIIRRNRLARASVLRESNDGPRFFHLRGYANVSILARKPWSSRSRGEVSIRKAADGDSDAVRRFLDAESRRRPFGPVFDESTWRHRLTTWPDFGLDRFYVAVDGRGELAGCLAPWDASTINRIVVDRLPPGVSALRLTHNLLSPLTGKPRIDVGPDTSIADIGLTHVSIRDRNPKVFSALLDAAYADLSSTGCYSTVSLSLFDGDPLWPALARYWFHAVPMDLYWLETDPGEREAPGPASALPGFESYLV